MKLFKKILIGILVLAALIYFVAIPYLHGETKKFSPSRTATLELGKSDLQVAYSSPAKKDRIIFGELVPYGKVWRTGANEPTTFSTSREIQIMDKALPSGTYSLWTVPDKNSWKVIFNTEIPDWGVTRVNGNQTTRNARYDLLTVEAPVRILKEPIEEFSITFEKEVQDQKAGTYLSLAWDTVQVRLPLSE